MGVSEMTKETLMNDAALCNYSNIVPLCEVPSSPMCIPNTAPRGSASQFECIHS